jgi:asparaginyl-tRNA synthetase
MDFYNFDRFNINKRINKQDRFFYAPIINGYIQQCTYKFFNNKDFQYFNLPIFNRKYFNKKQEFFISCNNKAYGLSESNAMYISALSAIYDKVYSISHVFRNETKKTSNHLIEFKLLEVEWKTNKYDEMYNLVEEYLKYIVNKYNKYIKYNNIEHIFKKIKIEFPIKRISYLNYNEELNNLSNNEINNPVFVTDLPCKFSWRALKKTDKTTYAYNVIVPFKKLEIIEGSARETSVEFYKAKFDNLGYDNIYKWYLEALNVDTTSRVGFGLGVERLCMWLMNLDDIEAQLVFPRKPEYIYSEEEQ